MEQIKSVNPDLKVVLFTGYPELDDAVITIEQSLASDYIAKPIPVDKSRRDAFSKKLHDTLLRLFRSYT